MNFYNRHPEYQQTMYEEIIKVIGHDRDPTFEDMKNFHFIEMFIKEGFLSFLIFYLV